MGYRYNAITGELDIVDTGAVPPDVARSFVTDSGTAVPALNILNLLGTSLQGISTAGASNTVTLTIDDSTTTQKGVVELATDAESIDGSLTDYHVINPSSLKAKLGVQTEDGIPYGTGDTVALGWTNALIDGQIAIGSTAGTPQAANLTSTGLTITITNGPNTINLEAGNSVATSFVTDSGTAVPVANVLNVLGTSAQGISSSGAGNTVTWTIADATEAQKGVIELATNAETTTGTSTSLGVHPAGLNTRLGTQTQYGVVLGGGGAGSNLDVTAAGSAGTLLRGTGASNPAFSTFTIPDTFAQGDLLLVSSANTITALTKDANSTRYLSNTGASNNAAWAQVDLSDGVTGTLPVGNGGTGDTTLTDHSVLVGSGANPITALAVAGNGELVIGSAGADPAVAALAPGDGSITITNGAGTIDLAVTSLGLTWSVVTVNASFTVNTGTIANKAGLLTMTLPATGAIGDIIRITGINTAVGMRIAQNANQLIYFGTSTTTTGAGGYIESTAIHDTVEIVCVVAGASTEWQVLSSLGNWTIV